MDNVLPASSTPNGNNDGSSGGLGTGPAVGVTVAVMMAVVVVVVIWVWRRRWVLPCAASDGSYVLGTIGRARR